MPVKEASSITQENLPEHLYPVIFPVRPAARFGHSLFRLSS